MTVTQLISLSEHAWSDRETVFGLPGGELTPEEMAGDMIRRLGLEQARAVAAERAVSFPAPWNVDVRVCQILEQASPG